MADGRQRANVLSTNAALTIFVIDHEIVAVYYKDRETWPRRLRARKQRKTMTTLKHSEDLENLVIHLVTAIVLSFDS